MQTGNIFIVTAPSGAGKTTLVAALLAADKDVQLSVSHTTRQPRAGEVHGEHYHFVDRVTFEAMIARKDFLEYAEVYGNYYGTSLRWLREQLSLGRDILLEIDWQGAQQVRKAFPQAVGIFILPPSVEALASACAAAPRTAKPPSRRVWPWCAPEIDHAEEADYLIINEQLDDAVRDLIAVVRAQRSRTARQMQARGEQVRAMQSQAR